MATRADLKTHGSHRYRLHTKRRAPRAQAAPLHMAKQRTVNVQEMRPGRFRPETVQRTARPRLSATLGELALAKQMARLDSQRREQE